MDNEFKLTPSVPVAISEYGSSVAVSGGFATVVAGHGGFVPGSGYAYMTTGSGWTQQAKLNASDQQGLNPFGDSVSIDGDYAIVGAPDAGSAGEGHAYVFHRSGSSW